MIGAWVTYPEAETGIDLEELPEYGLQFFRCADGSQIALIPYRGRATVFVPIPDDGRDQ